MRTTLPHFELHRSCAKADLAMARHADGDPLAFAELYDAIAPSLRRLLHRLSNDPVLTEDLLQQTFLHLHDKRAHFTIGAPVRPWAFAIARRLFIDSHRRRRREEFLDGEFDSIQRDTATPEDWELAREGLCLATAELQRLPLAQRDAYVLVRAEGMSHGEVATILGTTAAAVRVRVHRAVLALRAAVGIGSDREEDHDRI